MMQGSPSPLGPDHHAAGLIDAGGNPSRYDGHDHNPLEVADRFRAIMPKGVRVLYVGCGTGSATLIASWQAGNTILAIEPDPERAAIARSRGLDVHHGLLDDGFIAEHGTFDVVMSSDVLEHVPAPSEFLRAMIKATKPGGVLLLSVPHVAQ